MKNTLLLSIAALAFSMASGTVLAQDYDYHPQLSDTFTASLGYMRSSNSFKIEADNLTRPDLPGEKVDFEDSLGVDGHTDLFNGQISWKFGETKKWRLAGQYFSNNAKGDTVITEDIEWDDIIWREGSYVESGVKLAITRLFFGRSLIKNERNDFGIGAGIHNFDLTMYIEGEIKINEDTTGFQEAKISENQILPNVGAWYMFSPARNWLLHARADWIGANINDYSGHMWNASVGVGYQPWRHVGFDLAWQYFNVNISADKEDWRGGADITYSGPVLSITFGW